MGVEDLESVAKTKQRAPVTGITNANKNNPQRLYTINRHLTQLFSRCFFIVSCCFVCLFSFFLGLFH